MEKTRGKVMEAWLAYTPTATLLAYFLLLLLLLPSLRFIFFFFLRHFDGEFLPEMSCPAVRVLRDG